MRVLITDDSEPIRESLCALMARIEGVEVIGTASTGGEALEMIRRLKPDAMTLDIRMPDMNGIKVLETIKREDLKLMVIMLSGMGEEQYREKCLGLGAAHFFDKATEFESVLQVLGKKVAELRA